MKYGLLLVALITSASYSMDRVLVKRESVHVPGRLGNVDLYRTSDGYQIEKDGELFTVQDHRVSPLLKKFGPNTINRFLENGYISINQSNEGSYSLDGNVRVKGGGPILGTIMYVGTHVVSYTALLTGTMLANAAAPGAGGVATAVALGSGGVPAYVAGTQAAALQMGFWGLVAVPWF